MCIVVIKKTSQPDFSFFVAENRDENNDREWKSWGHYWEDMPDLYGCLDIGTNGTWILINRASGVLGMIINREKVDDIHWKSRSKILFKPLSYGLDAKRTMDVLSSYDYSRTSPFNAIIVDCFGVYYYNNMEKENLPKSLSSPVIMINRSNPNDFKQKRIKNNYHRFVDADEPNPRTKGYGEWEKILKEKSYVKTPKDEGTMCLVADKWKTQYSCIISISRGRKMPIIHDVVI